MTITVEPFALMVGVGVKAGTIYGKTDDQATKFIENPVTPSDFNATLAKLAGLNIHQEVFSPDNRPFTIAKDGKSVEGLIV